VRFHKALAPKMQGGLILDQLTRDRDLDLFVVISSVTAVYGNPGQSSYVAGNLFLEALMRKRHREGLPGTAIALGALGEVGAVARNASLGEVLGQLGVGLIVPAEVFAALENMLENGLVVGAVGRFDWGRMHQVFPKVGAPRFGALIPAGSEEAAQTTGKLRAVLQELPLEEIVDVVEQDLAQIVAGILHMLPDRLNHEKKLEELGMDSLMAIELSGLIDRRFGCTIPVMELLNSGSVHNLALLVAPRLRLDKAAPSSVERAAA